MDNALTIDFSTSPRSNLRSFIASNTSSSLSSVSCPLIRYHRAIGLDGFKDFSFVSILRFQSFFLFLILASPIYLNGLRVIGDFNRGNDLEAFDSQESSLS